MAVVRIEDEVYATGDRCTHKRVSLAEREVDNVESLLDCWNGVYIWIRPAFAGRSRPLPQDHDT